MAERYTVEHWLELILTAGDADRKAILEDLRTSDPKIHSDVAEMLLELDAVETGGFLRESAWDSISAPDREVIEVGSQLGRYTIVSALSEGGMSQVFRASDLTAPGERTVAIKIVNGAMTNSDGMEQFRREREFLAGLDHPGIGRILDAGETLDGRPFVVLEYYEGKSLSFENFGSSSLTKRLSLFCSVCEAVAFAHRHFVVHQDLKPDNILVDTKGAAKLLDFGIARFRGASAAPFVTWRYVAPEALNGEQVGSFTDVYSLGLILFELATGLPARREDAAQGHSLRESVLKDFVPYGEPVVRTDEVRRSSLWKRDFKKIVQTATARDPALRYQRVSELLSDLEQLMRNGPVSCRSKRSLLYRLLKRVERHPFLSSCALVLLILFSYGLISSSVEYARLTWLRRNTQLAWSRALFVATEQAFLLYDDSDSTERTRAVGTAHLRLLKSLDELDGTGCTIDPISAAYRKLASNSRLGESLVRVARERAATRVCTEMDREGKSH